VNMPWPCAFGCGLDALCGHREPELIVWVRELEAERLRHERQAYLDSLRRPVGNVERVEENWRKTG
jgi:hypothetical protein